MNFCALKIKTCSDSQYFTRVLQEYPILGCVAGVRPPHTPKSGFHQPFRDLLIVPLNWHACTGSQSDRALTLIL
jgi:hypothetical protein